MTIIFNAFYYIEGDITQWQMEKGAIVKPIDGLSPTLAINQLSAQMEKEGKEIFRFGFGQSPFPVPAQVVNALQKNAFQKDYLPTAGLSILREKVSSYYTQQTGIFYDAQQVLVGPGSKELIFLTQFALDATLILPSPSWVSYAPQADIIGREVAWLITAQADGYCLTADALDQYCKENKVVDKLLILNYPNNPTGTTYSINELKSLAAVARKHRLVIVSDEIYGELHHENEHVSIASFYPEGTIISSGLSKWCGAGGWRLGVFLIPKELESLKARMLQIASETFSCVSAPIQYAAVTAYETSEAIDTYLVRSRMILKVIANYVAEQLNQAYITTTMPQGGFYLFPDFSKYEKSLAERGINTSTDLCQRLLIETGVALLPGVVFGRPEKELTARLAYVDFNGQDCLDYLNSSKPTELNIDFVKHFAPKIIKGVNAIINWLQ